MTGNIVLWAYFSALLLLNEPIFPGFCDLITDHADKTVLQPFDVIAGHPRELHVFVHPFTKPGRERLSVHIDNRFLVKKTGNHSMIQPFPTSCPELTVADSDLVSILYVENHTVTCLTCLMFVQRTVLAPISLNRWSRTSLKPLLVGCPLPKTRYPGTCRKLGDPSKTAISLGNLDYINHN